ncbi:MAG: AI-2E family transporter [Akkermansiaceae bacterium]|nr:AI-2E family transporter [Akkermansiaceae bacterium]MCP5546781.1 AI-2E family transporter [Akkermansiaceae bacterium]
MKRQSVRKFWKAESWLGGLALLLLLAGCVWVIKPFFTALMWAIILTYSLYPLQRLFTRWFRGSRTLAACLVTLTVTVLVAGPVVLVGLSLSQDGKDLALATRKWFISISDEPPEWARGIPIVGDEVATYWTQFAEDRDRWMAQLDKEVVNAPRPKIVVRDGEEAELLDAPPVRADETDDAADTNVRRDPPHLVSWLGKFLAWARDGLIAAGLAVGQGVTQVLLSAFLAFFMLRDATELSERLGVAVERLAGERGQHLIKVAGDTVHGVIYGILGTAIAQAFVAGIGFWIAGVPGAVLLAVLTFFFAVVPFGPPLVWIPATFWLFAQDRPGWGLFMLIWGMLGISSVDNVLRPFLISQGTKLPFALIFCGVIGGALAFGLVGVFLGPTLLAVAFRLIEEWSRGSGWIDGNPDKSISSLPAKAGSDTPPPHGDQSLGVGQGGGGVRAELP